MSLFRNSDSLIWPRGPVCVGYLATQKPAPGERIRGRDQLEVTVRTGAYSLHSWRVERLLRRKGYAFELVTVTEVREPESRWTNTDGRGIEPRVFVDGRIVGGLRELRALDRSGDLDRLVRGEI